MILEYINNKLGTQSFNPRSASSGGKKLSSAQLAYPLNCVGKLRYQNIAQNEPL